MAWDLFVAVLWILDLRRLPAPAQLRVTREWTGPLGLGRPATVALTLEHDAPIVIEAQLADAPSTALRRDVPEVALTAWPGRPARGEYAVTPTERGDSPVGPVTVRYASAWKLATRWARVPVEQTVRVYPDLHAAQHHVLHLVRSQSLVAERRRARQHGAGREFERLRDYRDGDDRRDVCWTATARRGKLVTRLYRPERSQTVWIMLDGSRLLRARAGDRTKLDAAVDAALALAHVAQASGDRIGLVAYGRRVHARIAPDRGARHLRRLLEVLAQARAEAVEGDHAAAAAALLRTQQRRALIVWLTDLAETAGVPDVIECASQMADRHLVLCAMLRQMDVTALADTLAVDAGRSLSRPRGAGGARSARDAAARAPAARRAGAGSGARRRRLGGRPALPGDQGSERVVGGRGRPLTAGEAEIRRQQHEHRRADRELGQRIEAGGGDEALDQAGDDQQRHDAAEQPQRGAAGVDQALAPRPIGRHDEAAAEDQPGAAGDEDRRQLQRPVRRDEAPQRRGSCRRADRRCRARRAAGRSWP